MKDGEEHRQGNDSLWNNEMRQVEEEKEAAEKQSIDLVPLDWLRRPHLLPATNPPSTLPPPLLAGAKVIDGENLVIAFDCQLKWQL